MGLANAKKTAKMLNIYAKGETVLAVEFAKNKEATKLTIKHKTQPSEINIKCSNIKSLQLPLKVHAVPALVSFTLTPLIYKDISAAKRVIKAPKIGIMFKYRKMFFFIAKTDTHQIQYLGDLNIQTPGAFTYEYSAQKLLIIFNLLKNNGTLTVQQNGLIHAKINNITTYLIPQK